MKFEGPVNRRVGVWLIWLAMAAVTAYLFVFEPGKTGFFLNCPFRMLTGFTCPGCGMTRGLHSLLHGDLLGAFQFNPLMMLLLPVFLYAFVRYTIAVFRDQPIKSNQLDPKFIWMFFVVVMSFWVIRNTPVYPFVS